jgi:L-amino acid N-acyltransferase YncA
MFRRKALAANAARMAEILNDIIAIGGTTAHEHPLSPAEIAPHFIEGPGVETCVLAENAGRVLGWQSLALWQEDLHIGTFVRPALQANGLATGLFAATRDAARARGLTQMIAHIRADNAPGLACYARLGFSDIGEDPGCTLGNETVVGRIDRRFNLV